MTLPETELPGPVVIGGVGGSGTRLVAQIFLDLRYYLGASLNRSLDNLWFALLLTNPGWFNRVETRAPEAVAARFRLLAKAMTTTDPLSRADLGLALRAGLGLLAQSRNRGQVGERLGLLREVRTLARAHTADRSGCRAWGWKAPNSHLFLPHLAALFPEMRYVHVIRHGLDMAYSSNKRQLRLWGPRYGVAVPRRAEDIPPAALAYWVAANQLAVQTGQDLLGGRFLLLNFDALCREPEPHLRALLAFLDLDAAAVDVAALARLPKLPASAGRYRQHDLTRHDPALVEAVRGFGFVVD